MLCDCSKFVKTEFNSKHTVNKDIRHLLDMESEIKSCLYNLLDKNYLSKDDYMYLKPCGNQTFCMDTVKFRKVPQLMILYPLLNLFFEQLVPVATTL